jgi:hypothetical protein
MALEFERVMKKTYGLTISYLHIARQQGENGSIRYDVLFEDSMAMP